MQDRRRKAIEMPTSIAKAFAEMFWVSCLLVGVLLMISGATEGVPYTSVHIRGETFQNAVLGLGLFLALLGVYIGFRFRKKKK
jgi:LPXTG-motif cell wall-anchored protein